MQYTDEKENCNAASGCFFPSSYVCTKLPLIWIKFVFVKELEMLCSQLSIMAIL